MLDTKIQFTKMHGLGNDFIIIEKKFLPTHLVDDAYYGRLDHARQVIGASERRTANVLLHRDSSTEATKQQHAGVEFMDRRLGIGCDQLIIYDASKEEIDIEIYNQDGSRAKACGNASRCLMKLLYVKHGLTHTTFNVDGRRITARYLSDEEIEVNMGPVSFSAPWMPDKELLRDFAKLYMIDPKDMVCVDVGNPHLVIFSKMPTQDQEVLGGLLQKAGLFPDGVNVNFAEVIDDEITLRVWERGAGFTLACGSGACASFAAARKACFVANEAWVKFSLGRLLMRMDDDNNAIMTGPATFVCTGEYYV